MVFVLLLLFDMASVYEYSVSIKVTKKVSCESVSHFIDYESEVFVDLDEFDYSECRMAMSEVQDYVIDDIESEISRLKALEIDTTNKCEDFLPLGCDAMMLDNLMKEEEEAEQFRRDFFGDDFTWSEDPWFWSTEDEDSSDDEERIAELCKLEFSENESDSEEPRLIEKEPNYEWDEVSNSAEFVTQGNDRFDNDLFENGPLGDFISNLENQCEDFAFRFEQEHHCSMMRMDDKIENVFKASLKCKKILASMRTIDNWMTQNELWQYVERVDNTLEDHDMIELFRGFKPNSVTFYLSNRDRLLKDVWILGNLVMHFIPAVAQGNQNDLEESESLSKFENVTFVDERPVEATPAHFDGDNLVDDSHVDISEVPWTMRQVLQREQYIDTITWKVGDTGNLASFAFPKAMIKDGSVIQNQLRMCGFFRAAVELRIVMNGNKFMIGRVIAHTEPVRFSIDGSLNHIQSYPNFPHIFLDASVSNSAVLTLPFSSILTYFSQRASTMADDSVNTIGRFYLDVFNQLQAPEGGTQYVTITVYARFVNPSVHQTVYTVDKFSYSDGYVTQGKEDGTVIVNKGVQPPCFGDVGDNTVTLSLDRNGGKTTDASIDQGIDASLKEALQIPGFMFQGSWKVGDAAGNMLYSFPVSPNFVGPANVRTIENIGVVISPTFLNYISRCFAYWSGDIMIKIQVVGNAFASGRLLHVYDPTWVPASGPTQDLDELMNFNCVIQDVQEQQEIVIQVPFTSVRPLLRCDHWQYQQQFDAVNDIPKLAQTFMGYFRTVVLNQLVMPAQMTQTLEINYYMYAGPNFNLQVPVDLQPLSVDPAISSERMAREPVYPVLVDQIINPEFDNKDYIRIIWSQGLRLFKQGWLSDEKDWWTSKPIKGKGEIDEVFSWCYKARQLIEYAEDTEESQQKLLMRSLGRFNTLPPIYVTQGLEEFVTSRKAPELVPIVITKGNRPNKAPVVEANSLSKFLHRYYPLLISEPHLGLTGFTLYQIPVNPCFVPQVRKPIKNALPPATQVNQLAWISRMFAFWSGSLRYKIVFPNTDSDVYVAYIPQENMRYAIQSGISVQDVHALMSYAGDIAVTHVQGSLEVTVPFSSPYNQCMTNARGGHYDARNQNGTLMVYVRNKLQAVQPFFPAISIFIAAGSDFKLNWLISPPEIFDNSVHFNCVEPKFLLMQSESHKEPTDFGQCIRTPTNCGFTEVARTSVIGICEGEPNEGAVAQGLTEVLKTPFTFMANMNRAAQSLPEQVNRFNQNIEEVKEAVTNAADNTCSLARKAEEYLELAASTLLAGNVIRSFIKVCTNATPGNFVDLALSSAAMLGYSVRQSLISLIHRLLNHLSVEKEEQSRAQAMNGAILDVVEDNENIITKSIAVLGTILYAYVFDCMPDLAKLKKWLQSFLTEDPVTQGFDLRGAHFGFLGISALTKVFDNLVIYTKKFVDWILERDSPEALLARKAEGIKDQLMAVIEELDRMDNEIEIVRALQDPNCHNKFYKLVDVCNEMTKIFMDGNMDARVGLILTECRTRAKKLVTRLEREAPTHGWRYDPFVVCLHGKSGTGKTAIMNDISDLIADRMGLSEFNRTYSKTINDDFWSGYTGQPIVQWDEFGQNAQKDSTVAQFVELRGNTPYKLNMAALEDKGRHFTSKAIVMTTNVPYHTFGTVIRNKTAYLRRRHVMIEMVHKNGLTANAMQNREGYDADYSHCDFYLCSNESEKVKEGPYTKSQIMHYLRKKVSWWEGKQKAFYDEYIRSRGLGYLPRGVIIEINGVQYEEDEDVIELPPAVEPLAPLMEIVDSVGEKTYTVAASEKGKNSMCVVMGKKEVYANLNCMSAPSALPPVRWCKMTYDFSQCDEDELNCLYIDRAAFCYVPITDEAAAREGILQYGKRKLGGLKMKAEALFADLKSKIVDIYKKYPKLLIVSAALGTLTAVATTYLLIRSEDPEVEQKKPEVSWEVVEPNFVNIHDKKDLVKMIRAEHQNYDNAQNKRQVKLVQAEHQIYDNQHARRPVKLVRAEGNEDQNSTDIRKVVQPNLVVIGWDANATKRTVLRGLHLGGQLLLLPYHFFAGAKEGERFILAHRLNPIYVDFEVCNLARLDDKDWCLYNCGARFEPRRNISKYFIRESSLGKLSQLNAMLCNVDSAGNFVIQKGLARSVLNFTYTDGKTEKYVQRGWETNFATESGDCGAFLMAMTPAIPAPGKILGIHTAGVVKRSQGFSVLITFEQLQKAIAMLPPQVFGMPVPKEVDRDDSCINSIRCMPEGDYSIYGSMPNKLAPSQPMKTDFKKTPFSEDLVKDIPNKKKPAHLHPFKNEEGQMVSPLRKALAKYGQATVPFKARTLNKAKKFVLNMFKNQFKGTSKKVFSEKEAILGIPGMEFADRLNMKSSPGWPYQVLNKKEAGKFYMFDDEGTILCKELRERLNERHTKAKQGERVASLWRDCMKDELRANEKVDEGKTRLFTIAPVDYTILTRQYFMDFAINFYANCCNFFSAVGINPESYEWTKLYNYLAECGNKCVAGDYKSFDGTLMPEVIDAVADIINGWYDDGPENARVRKVLISEMIHTMQLVENCVYATHQGNPSGNPLTVIINTIVNYLYLCCIFIELYPDLPLQVFFENTRVICYGDDFLVTVKDLLEKFNFNNMRKILKEHGIGLTTDQKNAEQEEPDFVDLDTVTFLKRGFRVDPEFGTQFRLPIMSTDTLYSYFHWVRKSEEEEAQLNENMRSSLAFACFHGREFYNSFHDKWEECMRDAGYDPICITFEEQVDAFLVNSNAVTFVGAERQFFDNVTEGEDSQVSVVAQSEMLLAAPLTRAQLFFVYLRTVAWGVAWFCIYKLICFCEKQAKKYDAVAIRDNQRTDRWAICMPSGEGKTTLARKFPKYFVDHDDLILFKGEYPAFDLYMQQKLQEKHGLTKEEIQTVSFLKKLSIMHDMNCWFQEWVRTEDVPVRDRRILLTHAPSNTYRQIADCYLLPEPTNVRNNLVGRQALEKISGVKFRSFEDRERECIEHVRTKEQEVYDEKAYIFDIERTVGHFTSRVST